MWLFCTEIFFPRNERKQVIIVMWNFHITQRVSTNWITHLGSCGRCSSIRHPCMCWNREQRRSQVGNITDTDSRWSHLRGLKLLHNICRITSPFLYFIMNCNAIWPHINESKTQMGWKKVRVSVVQIKVLCCSPVVAFLLQRLSRWIKHAVVFTGTIWGRHTAAVLVDQTWGGISAKYEDHSS